MNSLLIILVCGAVSCAAVPFRQLKCDQDDLKRCEALQPNHKDDVMFPYTPETLDSYCGRAQPYFDCYYEVVEMCPKLLPNPAKSFAVRAWDLVDRVCDHKNTFRSAYLQFAKCLGDVFTTQQTVCAKEAEAKEKYGTCPYFRLVETCMQDKALQTCTRDSYYVFSEIYDVTKVLLENGACDGE